MSQDKRWVVLENGEPHTLLLTAIEALNLAFNLQVEFPLKRFTTFYDEYYEYIDYYSEEEKEQVNRLIP
jgi:hypothetical protein